MRWGRFGLALTSIWLASCSVLVDPGSLVIKCEIDPTSGPTIDPCMAAGLHCIASECKACVNAVELCNGIDDDCDGMIDEGLDEDGDGFTWCGGGQRQYADCAPSDPTIHPAGPPGPDGRVTIPAPQELCDGKDNDCDGKVDEAPECAGMHSCQDGCSAGQICNSATGMCIQPRPVGSGCTTDSDCAGGFCVQPNSFGLTVDLKDGRCASACCTDSDCAADSVCVVSNSGTRLCLPSSIAGRAELQAGDRCARDSECASGACDRSNCADRCFDQSDCGGNDVCTLSPGNLSEPRLWLCGSAQGRDAYEAPCTPFDPTGCRSGLCTSWDACAKPCARNADCGSDETCTYAPTRPLLSFSATSLVSTCQPRSVTGGSSDVLCCTNSDCSTGHLCAPKTSDMNLWIMSCQ